MAERDIAGTLQKGLANRIKASFGRLAEVDIDGLPLIGKLSPDARYVRLVLVLVASVLLSFLCIGYYLFQVGKPARNAAANRPSAEVEIPRTDPPVFQVQPGS